MTEVNTVYSTLEDGDDVYEVNSSIGDEEESYDEITVNDEPEAKPQHETKRETLPEQVETSNSSSMDDDGDDFSVTSNYSSAYVLELPRLQPTVSDLTCFIDILGLPIRENDQIKGTSPTEKTKKVGLRLSNQFIFHPKQSVDPWKKIMPQKQQPQKRMSSQKRSTSRQRRVERKVDETTKIVPEQEQKQQQPKQDTKKRRNSMPNIATTANSSTTCHYLSGKAERRGSTSSSASTIKKANMADTSSTRSPVRSKRRTTIRRKQEQLDQQKQAMDALIAGEGFAKVIASSTKQKGSRRRGNQQRGDNTKSSRKERRHTMPM